MYVRNRRLGSVRKMLPKLKTVGQALPASSFRRIANAVLSYNWSFWTQVRHIFGPKHPSTKIFLEPSTKIFLNPNTKVFLVQKTKVHKYDFFPLTSDLSPARHCPWSNRAFGRTIAKVGRSSETAQTCSAGRRSNPAINSFFNMKRQTMMHHK